MTSPLTESETRLTVTKDETGQVNIYQRSNGGRYYYEIRMPGYPKKRLTTGSTNEGEASRIALQKYIEAKRRVTAPISTLITLHLEDRFEQEVVKGVITKGTYDQAKTVLKDYFAIWAIEIALPSIDEISIPLLTRYVRWRKDFYQTRSAEHDYERKGRKVKGNRASIHFKSPAGSALNKEFNAINKFFYGVIAMKS